MVERKFTFPKLPTLTSLRVWTPVRLRLLPFEDSDVEPVVRGKGRGQVIRLRVAVRGALGLPGGRSESSTLTMRTRQLRQWCLPLPLPLDPGDDRPGGVPAAELDEVEELERFRKVFRVSNL